MTSSCNKLSNDQALHLSQHFGFCQKAVWFKVLCLSANRIFYFFISSMVTMAWMLIAKLIYIWFNYRKASYGGSSTSFLKQSWGGNVLPWQSADSPFRPKSVWRVWLEPLTCVWLVFLVNMVFGQTHTTVVAGKYFQSNLLKAAESEGR